MKRRVWVKMHSDRELDQFVARNAARFAPIAGEDVRACLKKEYRRTEAKYLVKKAALRVVQQLHRQGQCPSPRRHAVLELRLSQHRRYLRRLQCALTALAAAEKAA